jgi:hypothetical protein
MEIIFMKILSIEDVQEEKKKKEDSECTVEAHSGVQCTVRRIKQEE